MTLEKPKDEECGNCYYCVSKLLERQREESTGLFSSKTIKEAKELFWCRRNSPSPVLVGSSEGTNIQRIVLRPLCEEGVPVDSDYWCGEWRRSR
jgi:hypothetical protein